MGQRNGVFPSPLPLAHLVWANVMGAAAGAGEERRLLSYPKYFPGRGFFSLPCLGLLGP